MTADTYSTDGVGVLLMGTGNDNNTWGANANTNVFQIFADAISNSLTTAASAGALGASNTLDLSTSPPPAATSLAHYGGLIFTGAITANQTVKVPNLSKWWLVKNATTGAFTVKFKTPSGTASSAISQNSGWQVVYCDASDGIVVWPFNTAQIQMPDGSVSAPPHSYVNETNSGWYRNGTQDHRLAIAGADVLQVTGAGAGTPSVINVLSPNALQIAGAQVTPAGVETAYAGISAPTGWYFSAGQTVNRTTDAALFSAITATATGNTHTSTTVNNLSTDLRGLGLEGGLIEGTGISLGTTIVSVDSAVSMTISAAATSTASGINLRFLPYGQGDGSTTFVLPDRRGRAIFGRDNMTNSAAGRLGTIIAGNKLAAADGGETHTLLESDYPNVDRAVTVAITDLGHSHNIGVNAAGLGLNTGAVVSGSSSGTATATAVAAAASKVTGITASGTVRINGDVTQTAVSGMPPCGISNIIIKR